MEKYCEQCQNELFAYANQRLCQQCEEKSKLDQALQTIKEYLAENPKAGVPEVLEATDVSYFLLRKLIDAKRIDLVFSEEVEKEILNKRHEILRDLHKAKEDLAINTTTDKPKIEMHNKRILNLSKKR